MIAKLRGRLDSIDKNFLILDVNGVGYRVFGSQRLLSHVATKVGENIELLIETVVREDLINLYGFQTSEEMTVFRTLLSVQGVGLRVALGLMSLDEPGAILQAIAEQNKKFITRAEGVGPKLASRIVNELKDKVGSVSLSVASPTVKNKAAEEAISALVNLGYRWDEVENPVYTHLKEDESLTVEQLIPRVLSYLSGGRK